jgi:hypothetical protein
MKNKRWLVILLAVAAFICTICAVVGGILYIRVRSQPPHTAVNGAGYYIRGGTVYYLGGFPSTAFEIEGADSRSFTIIDESHAFDNTRVYLNGIPITDADPATFHLLEPHFSADANHVFLQTEIFSDDPAHFEFLDGSLMRDSRYIYWSTEIISEDPANLTVLDSPDYVYFKDSTTVFIQGNPIEGADVGSFSVISDAYAQDKANMYYFDQVIEDVDAASFEVIESPYSRDATQVYWMEEVIEGATPTTFQILNLDFQCTADDQHAYYENRVIENADPSTFPADVIVTNCDDMNIYFFQ